MIARLPTTQEVKGRVDALIAKLNEDLWQVNHKVRATHQQTYLMGLSDGFLDMEQP